MSSSLNKNNDGKTSRKREVFFSQDGHSCKPVLNLFQAYIKNLLKQMDNHTQKYKKSEFPFKSPHWKGKWGLTFNVLSEIAGDHRIMPSDHYGKTVWESRETPVNKLLSEEIIEMMNNFMALEDFTSIKNLEKTLPLRYVYILPARHGIVIYSAYSFLISQKDNVLADYREVREYLGVPANSIYTGVQTRSGGVNSKYFVYALHKHYFRLYTLSKPFRCLLNLPLKKRSVTYKNEHMISHSRKITNDFCENMTEWDDVSSPGLILTKVREILMEHGFKIALQFVRSLFRASGLIRFLLINQKGDLEKIQQITKRYLNLEILLDLMGPKDDLNNLSQSSLKDWLK